MKEKDPYVQQVYNLPRVKLFVDSKNIRSTKTGGNYRTALVHLNSFVTKQYNKNSHSIIDYLTNGGDVYELLQGYSNYLQSTIEGITPNSIDNYIAALRSYFAKFRIGVVSAFLKNEVTLPRKIKESEVPIDKSDIRKILLSCNNPRLKAYLLVLASSGVRADTEACSIRNKDVNWSSSPVKIMLRGEFSKTKTKRFLYISDESAQYLKEFIQYRGETAPEQLLFTSYKNKIPTSYKETKRLAHNIYIRINIDFMKLLQKVGMDKRKESGLVNKKRHEITLHSFRRFTYSTVEDQTNTGYANYILGHSNSPYHTKKEEVRTEMYLTKCMSELTILDYTALDKDNRDTKSKLEQEDLKIAELNRQISQLKEEKEKDKADMLKEMDKMLQMRLELLVSKATNRINEAQLTGKLPGPIEINPPLTDEERESMKPVFYIDEQGRERVKHHVPERLKAISQKGVERKREIDKIMEENPREILGQLVDEENALAEELNEKTKKKTKDQKK